MGSLAGHCIAGTFFLFYGLWWSFCAVWLDVQKLSSERGAAKTGALHEKYKNKSWMPIPCYPKLPLESILKILLPLVAILAEAFLDIVQDESGHKHIIPIVYHVHNDRGVLNDLGKLYHIVIYCFFPLSGILDIISIFCTLPEKASQFFFTLAFFVEGILFHFHVEGRDELNIHIHNILTYIIATSVVFAFLRMKTAVSFPVNIGLAFSMILQGTWFIQTGFTLFPPKGIPPLEGKNRIKNMYVSACFGVHVLVISVTLLLLWVVLKFVVKKLNPGKLPCPEECCNLMDEDATSTEMTEIKS